MRPVDIGIDAARILRVPGPGRVCAVFARAIYLQLPAGLVALVTVQSPRGPLYLRVAGLPDVLPGCAARVDVESLRIGDYGYRLDAPTWSPRLPPPASLIRARGAARRWLPDLAPALDVGSTGRSELPDRALAALRRADLVSFAATVVGRGPGLTPAGDDMLAGVLLVARAMRIVLPAQLSPASEYAHRARTNDVASAFLACAAEGRCIEPAHDLLDGLATVDHCAVTKATERLRMFGSSSGAALVYGIRAGLLELPRTCDGRDGART